MNNLYLAEVYTKNPKTHEGGWDIQFAWIGASSLDAAVKKAEMVPNFDEVIMIDEQFSITPLGGNMRANCQNANLHFIDAY